MARPKDSALEEQRRAQVMLATYELLSQFPYEDVTLDRVARAAGVSKGLLTYYFPSKDALMIATIRGYHAEQEKLLRAVVSAPGPRAERLARLVYAAFPSRESVEKEVRFQIEVWSFAKRSPEAWDAVAESYRRFRAACAELLGRDGEASGRYLLMHALIDGLTFQVALDRGLGVESTRALAEETFRRWVGARPPVARRRKRDSTPRGGRSGP